MLDEAEEADGEDVEEGNGGDGGESEVIVDDEEAESTITYEGTGGCDKTEGKEFDEFMKQKSCKDKFNERESLSIDSIAHDKDERNDEQNAPTDRKSVSSDSFGESCDKFDEKPDRLSCLPEHRHDSQAKHNVKTDQVVPESSILSAVRPFNKAPRPMVKLTGRQMSAQTWSDLFQKGSGAQHRRPSCVAERGARRGSVGARSTATLRIRDAEGELLASIPFTFVACRLRKGLNPHPRSHTLQML